MAYCVHLGAVLTELAEKGMPAETLAMLGDSECLAGSTVAWLAGRYLSATWDMDQLLRAKEEIVANDKLKVRLIV